MHKGTPFFGHSTTFLPHSSHHFLFLLRRTKWIFFPLKNQSLFPKVNFIGKEQLVQETSKCELQSSAQLVFLAEKENLQFFSRT